MWRTRLRESVPEPNSSEFWIPYSDLMAGLLGVFAVLLIATLYSLGERVESVKEIFEERSEIARQMLTRFAGDPRVEVLDSGGILFEGDVLFEPDRWELLPEGKDVLTSVMPTYLDVLLGDQAVKSQLEQIVIVGHADTTFRALTFARNRSDSDRELAYKHNLELSQKRALTVMTFLLDDPVLSGSREELKRYAFASGRSSMDPVLDSQGTIDLDRSRRIEIRFTLKDEELVQKVILTLFGALGGTTG